VTTAPVRTDRPGEAAVPAGLRWLPNGQVVLSGPLYRLFLDCDAAFTALADTWGAAPEEHPAMIDAAALQSVDYLDSFPHLATFAVCLDADEDNLRAFRAGPPLDPDGAGVRLTGTAPVREILTPAACYHLYLHHRDEQLPAATYLTTRNTCFRREAYYEPLRRQWSFRMREIVCLGTREEVIGFLTRTRVLVDALLRELGLPVEWVAATDPFFEPARNPRYLAQRLRPTKHEAQFGGSGADGIAIASANLHEDHFGEAFGIGRAGRPAVSGCMAFGLERWLYAIVRAHGTDPAGWPDVAAAGRRALAAVAAAAAATTTPVGAL
jgi:seryl-tRNA synthetase